MDENNHLPLYGIGPYVIGLITFITLIALGLSYFNCIPKYRLNPSVMTVLGVLLIILGAIFWISAVKNSDIQENIRQNSLVTTGIYAIVRHPIYAAFLYAITGVILIANNLTLIIFPIIYWIILTVTMRKTEEKWLLEQYGDDYLNYMKKVNGFIPKVI
jgi:protein-S-isoprenylcysteine O-methyltransferase Ste14